MDRRSVIKNFLVVSAGVALMPSCIQGSKQSSVKLDYLTISSDQEELLAGLAETILPKTTSLGAGDLSAHLFALTMVDDCFGKEDRERFQQGLKAFEEETGKRFSKPFTRLSAEEKTALLKDLEAGKDVPEDAVAFYHTMKGLTVQCFVTSEYFMTTVSKYEMAPARYHGCVPVA